MWIFEIIGELINPSPVGKVDLNDDDYNIRQKLIPIRFIISLIIIGIIEYLFVFQMEYLNNFSELLKVNAFLIFYLLISYKMSIRPDYDNLGWVSF